MNYPRIEQTSKDYYQHFSVETFKDRLKVMLPTSARIQMCISYISIYTPDLSSNS